jgi:hypothetical protein
MKELFGRLFSGWHVSRGLVAFYAVALMWFRPTVEGFIFANIMHHLIASTALGFALVFDPIQRRVTGRSLMKYL